MIASEIKQNLNRPVRFTNRRLYIEGGVYILTGATIRLGDGGFYYQAELTDPRHRQSLIVCRLDEIEPAPAHVPAYLDDHTESGLLEEG